MLLMFFYFLLSFFHNMSYDQKLLSEILIQQMLVLYHFYTKVYAHKSTSKLFYRWDQQLNIF